MAVYNKEGSRFWWYAFVFKGRRIQRSSKVENKREAENIEKAAWTQLARGEVGIADRPERQRVTVGELLDKLKTDFELRGKASAQNLSIIARAKKDFGTRMADSLTSEDVTNYIERRLKKARPATINRILQPIAQCHKLAKLPAPEIKHLSEKDDVRTGFFSDVEFRAVLSNLPGDLRDFVLFGYLCGWRKGSISSLRWEDVDLDAREINLPGEYTKNGEPLTMAIEGELAEVMARRKDVRAFKTDSGATLTALVFHRNGEPVREFRKSWRTACKLAKCPGKLFHDLRRTAARDLIRSGVHESVAMRVTGHLTNSMFQRYNITNTDDLREAMLSVEKYRKAQQQKVAAISAAQ
jgi:integrase